MTGSSLAQEVVVGVDTHKDIHIAVALDIHGRRLGELTVPTTEVGCIELHRWALGFAPRACYGVEGTGSYGADLSRYLQAQGSSVLEIRGPNHKEARARRPRPSNSRYAARSPPKKGGGGHWILTRIYVI